MAYFYPFQMNLIQVLVNQKEARSQAKELGIILLSTNDHRTKVHVLLSSIECMSVGIQYSEDLNV